METLKNIVLFTSLALSLLGNNPPQNKNMNRRETSVTQVNAAVDYLIENNVNLIKPLNEINVFVLRLLKLTPKIS